MKLFYVLAASAAVAAICQPGAASAQTTNSIVDYYNRTKGETPTSGDVVFEPRSTTLPQRVLHVSDIDVRLSFLDVGRLNQLAPDVQNPLGVFVIRANVLGVILWGDYISQSRVNGAQGPGNFIISMPCQSTLDPNDQAGLYYSSSGVTRTTSDEYGAYFVGATYDQSIAAYRAFVDGNGTPTGYTGTKQFSSKDYRAAIYSCSAQTSQQNPIAGNADSLQFRTLNDGLDLSGGSHAEHATDRSQDLGDGAWGVGVREGKVIYGGHEGFAVDARVNRSWRVGHGTRALISVDVPVRYQHMQGHNSEWSGSAAVSLTLPVTRMWTIEPRVAYGFVSSPEQQLKGQLVTETIASHLFFDHLFGRGTLTIGNMVGFSKVSHVELAGQSIPVGVTNYSLRNGIAYELPLRGRVLGRIASIRGSYLYSTYYGDDIFMRRLHEFTLSTGVRSRGENARNSFELIRIGAIARFNTVYQSYLGYLGYRF